MPKGISTIRIAVAASLAMIAAVLSLAAPSAAQDPVLCGGKTPTITAETIGGTIMGTAGADVIVGSVGNDRILGLGGNDTICGLAGHDRLDGGPGNDLIVGGRGKDVIRGGPGRDVLRGGPRNDRLSGGSGRDLMFGGQGSDLLKGGRGSDDLIGNAGRRDFLIGGRGVDNCIDGDAATKYRNCEGGTGPEPFSLTLLHVNDQHSHLNEDGTELEFNGKSTDVVLGGAPRVVAKMRELEATHQGGNVVKISAGDAITGTLFFSLFKGEADAALMNETCFDLFGLGNHEFDESDAGLKVFLDFLAEGDCDTTVLGANVVPAAGTPLAPESGSLIEASRVIAYGSEQVGYVGLDIAGKTRNSSSPLETTMFLDEIETAQSEIDQLQEAGVDKIVLVTHIGLGNDLDLASMVSGVDVIVGGDSHTLLGEFDDVGLNSQGEYPQRVSDMRGDPVCIVHGWEYSKIVGELNVLFDDGGRVTTCNGTPHLLLGDTFEREPAGGGDEVPLTGADLAEVTSIIDSTPELSIVTPDAGAQVVLDGFSEQVSVLEQTVVGNATSDLCLERIPGQGRSTICDVSETAEHGGDIQQLVTEAFRVRSFEADIAIQNSGGVRIDIPMGDVTIADAFELLPFANTIVNLEMTGAEIVTVLEEAVDFALDPDGSTGAYPYASGLRWDVNLNNAAGQRLSNIEVRPSGTETWVPLEPATTYTVATNSFVAGGGDNYTTFEAVVEDGRSVDTLLDYAQSFIDYIEEDVDGTLSKLAVSEYSTQSFVGLAG